MEELIAKAFATALLSAFTLYFSYFEMRELIFYRRNGWDFSVNNNISPFTVHEGDSTSVVSNKDRVLFSLPFVIYGLPG